MRDTIVTFQDGADLVDSVPPRQRAKHPGYYCDVSRWRRFGTDTLAGLSYTGSEVINV